ncbi:hypothetical protein [Methylobacterium sp. NEAU K]|uniref:DUF6894 family protein n=1 Tax=Methylobacterium sp. NEAU K TaxID=3064946 RepID=UPI0027349702|nr:hypothetical protein [Methylobacterium sp. NEAU K]MDP4003552.1 hypothetical protein [Methylobacterium sp. NEAU K]
MRYYTDFIDGSALSRDEEGLEFGDRREACRSAAEALVEIAHDTLRCRHAPLFTRDRLGLHMEALVRDEAGLVVFRARLDLALDWSDDLPGGR